MRFFALTTPALRAVPAPAPRSARPDDATLAAHMARTRYGQFTLTDAVRPGWQLDIVPRAGYRHDAWVDPQGGGRLPALVAAATDDAPMFRDAAFASPGEQIAARFGTRGAPIAISTACATGASAIQLGVEAIRRGEAEAVLAIGADGTVEPSR